MKFASKAARRATSWSMFGIAGLALTATWASGVAGGTSTAGTPTAGAGITATAPSAGASVYASKVTSVTALSIDYTGRWGVIAAATPMFKVDLAGFEGTFFVEVALGNMPVGFAALEVKFVKAVSGDGTCDAADVAAGISPSVLSADNADATALFTGIAVTAASDTDDTHCIGVPAATPFANDSSGTFIRRATTASTPATHPNFVAVLNRSA